MTAHVCVRSEQNKVCSGGHEATEAQRAAMRAVPYPESFTKLSEQLRRRAEQRAKENR